MNELRTLVGKINIEDLPMPFTAVATDVVNQKEVWLSRGDLFDAIRASITIPWIFTPKVIDHRTLVDGGLLNPLAVTPATDHTTDLTIAVSLSGRDVSEPLGPNPLPARTGSIEAYRSRIESFIGTVQVKLGIEQSSGNKWTVPIGLGINKTINIGKIPVRFGLEAYYSVVKPDDVVGAEWDFRFYMIPAAPSALFKWMQ